MTSWLRRVGAPVVLLLALLPAAGTGASGNQKIETFDAADWFMSWGMDKPWHTSVVTDPIDGSFLRIEFPRTHNGTSWKLSTGSADTVTLKYRIRFGPTWLPQANVNLGEDTGHDLGPSTQTGKIPGFGLPLYNADGSCAEGCGLAPIVGPHYSARASFNRANVPGSYVYTPQCGEVAARTGRNTAWTTQPMVNGVWYEITQQITMNTPGVPNGSIKAWVNGTEVFHATDYCFRSLANPTVPVGNAWFEFYYGGKIPPRVPTWIDFDDVQVDW